MARIVVITHEFDGFNSPTRSGSTRLKYLLRRGHPAKFRRKYLIRFTLEELRKRGHSIAVMVGTKKRVPGDVAILHTDCSIVPQDYREAAAEFPIAINAGTHNITKRFISDAVLDRDSAWQGPVIVKSNFNSGGGAEEFHNRFAERQGREPPHPEIRPFRPYQLFDSPSLVPEEFWRDDQLVVEKFVAEPDPEGFAIRNWVFFGDRETCMRNVSLGRSVKAADIVRQEPSPVPDELREKRRELGFQYGKFDFAIHEGRGILFDANRTPNSPESLWKPHEERAGHFADGFESLLD